MGVYIIAWNNLSIDLAGAEDMSEWYMEDWPKCIELGSEFFTAHTDVRSAIQFVAGYDGSKAAPKGGFYASNQEGGPVAVCIPPKEVPELLDLLDNSDGIEIPSSLQEKVRAAYNLHFADRHSCACPVVR